MARVLDGSKFLANLRATLDVRRAWHAQSPYARAILMLVYLGFVTGTYAVAAILIWGPGLLHATDYVPWGIGISTYIFFVLTSTGLCFVSSLGHVFGIGGYEAIGKRAVFLAIITLMAGFAALAPDLGRPERMVFYLLTPHFSSLLWWMGFLYFIYFVFMVAEFLSLHKSRMDWARAMGVGGLLSAIGAHSTLGGVFGVVMTRPFYFGAFMPLYFLLTAFLSGIAAISLASITTSWGRSRQFTPEVVDISCRLRKLLVGVLGITLLFTFWKVLVGLYAEPYREIYGDVIRGPLWQSEVILGLGFPLILAILAGYRRIRAVPAVLAASGLVLVGLFMGRLDMVLAGQALPLKALIAPELSSYIPSAAEIMVVVGALSLCVLLYAIGGTFLRLEAVPLAHSSSTKDT